MKTKKIVKRFMKVDKGGVGHTPQYLLDAASDGKGLGGIMSFLMREYEKNKETAK